MITVTFNPTTAAHCAAISQAMLAMLDSITPPAATDPAPTPEAIAKAIAHAKQIQAQEAPTKVEEPKDPKPTRRARDEKPAPTPIAPVTDTSPTTESAAPEAAQESPSEPAIEYAVVQKAITDRAKTDRDGALAILATFGVKNGTALKPEQYAAVLKAFE